jgi:hypothetical protein
MLAFGEIKRLLQTINELTDSFLNRTIAITPAKSKLVSWEKVVEVCRDYAVYGIETIASLADKPLRFVYISGVNAERDQEKKPWLLGDYSLMRVRHPVLGSSHAIAARRALVLG